MQYVLAALPCEETPGVSILIKCNLWNLTLWIPPALDARGRGPFFTHLHASAYISNFGLDYRNLACVL